MINVNFRLETLTNKKDTIKVLVVTIQDIKKGFPNSKMVQHNIYPLKMRPLKVGLLGLKTTGNRSSVLNTEF